MPFERPYFRQPPRTSAPPTGRLRACVVPPVVPPVVPDVRLRLHGQARSRLAWRSVLSAALFVPLLMAFGPSRADPLSDVQRLYYGGQPAEAMRRADEALAGGPPDPALRFMKGVMLADGKRDTEAIAVFEKLTDDYPDLAEPYNNLAGLYAAGAQYDRARAALEQALRVNPAYATAWENLGDVLVALAAQAYGRVERLDPTQTSATAKLRSARDLLARDVRRDTGRDTGRDASGDRTGGKTGDRTGDRAGDPPRSSGEASVAAPLPFRPAP